MRKSDSFAYSLATVAGMGLWFFAALSSGKREAWDAAVYWTVAYPLAMGVASLMGYIFSERPWRWALTLFLAQFAAMIIHNRELGSLWPMGLMMFVVLSIPGVALAKLAAWLRGKVSSKS